MKEGPYTIETKGAARSLNAPGMIISSDKAGNVKAGIDVIAAQLNRAHEAGEAIGRKAREDEEAKLADVHRVQRDGWKLIAESLLNIGLGYEMRGFGDTPPSEILTALGVDIGGNEIATSDRAPKDAEALERIRDAMFGRAWRCAGSKGRGLCDYPLCPDRARLVAAGQAMALADVPLIAGVVLRVCVENKLDIKDLSERRKYDVNECHRWAQWVAQRAKAGRIEVAR